MRPRAYLDYVDWLRANAPAAYENLAPGATAEELDDLEAVVGRSLPAQVRAVLAVNNGQRRARLVTGGWEDEDAVECLPSLTFLSTTQIADCWRMWEELRNEETPEMLQELQDMGSTFPSATGRVRPLYTSPGWIPLWADPGRSDYLGIDLDPDVDGTEGQIINFGRDEERHFLCAPNLAGLLEILLSEVRSGTWTGLLNRDPSSGRRHLFETLYHHAES